MTDSPPALSVIVMGYRNERTILSAIDSVLAQEASEPYEVVVVTSGDERSADLVRTNHPNLALVATTERLLPGGARNAGLAVARGEFVAFLAGDFVAMPGWVEGRLRRHRAGVHAVAAAKTNAGPERHAAWAHMYLLYSARLPGRPAGTVSPPDPAIHGLSYSRHALDLLGRFDEHVLVGEDTSAALRLQELGIELWFEPAVVNAHAGPANVRQLFLDLRSRGRVRSQAVPEEPSLLAASRVHLVWIAVRRVRRHVWDTVKQVRSYAARDQPQVFPLLPWIIVGATGRQVGRCEAQWGQLPWTRPPKGM